MKVPVTELKMVNYGLAELRQAETNPKKINNTPRIERGRFAKQTQKEVQWGTQGTIKKSRSRDK